MTGGVLNDLMGLAVSLFGFIFCSFIFIVLIIVVFYLKAVRGLRLFAIHSWVPFVYIHKENPNLSSFRSNADGASLSPVRAVTLPQSDSSLGRARVSLH